MNSREMAERTGIRVEAAIGVGSGELVAVEEHGGEDVKSVEHTGIVRIKFLDVVPVLIPHRCNS